MTEDLPVFAPGFGQGASTPPPRGDARLPLREWRVAHGLSQFQAAVRLGVSLSSWIRWETKGVPELRRAWLEQELSR